MKCFMHMECHGLCLVGGDGGIAFALPGTVVRLTRKNAMESLQKMKQAGAVKDRGYTDMSLPAHSLRGAHPRGKYTDY